MALFRPVGPRELALLRQNGFSRWPPRWWPECSQLLTELGAGWLLGERVMARQWFGLVLGFVGVILVISGKFGLQTALGPMLIPALAALLGITIGTLYQKRFCSGFDLRTGSVIQRAQRADSQR